MCESRLDGRADGSLFERKSGECSHEQTRLPREIGTSGAGDGQYVEAGIKRLEHTRNMHRLFEKQQADEKRRLLNFVVSNSIWKGGEIVPVWRQPFDMMRLPIRRSAPVLTQNCPETGDLKNWLPEKPGIKPPLRS